jgi:glc operon protein GlcG
MLTLPEIAGDPSPLGTRKLNEEEGMSHVTRRNFVLIAAAAGGTLNLIERAQAQVPQYGAEINLEQAKKAIAAGQEEARKNNWPVAIAIVDNHGFLVAFEKMDNTQTASVQVAIDKAVSSATYRRPTKAFQDALAGGGAGVRALNLRGASTVEGGLPIVLGGKIIGGVGVSGVNADQDGMVAKAAASVFA